MPILSAYLSEIIIWSMTPRAIQWSDLHVGNEFGVALRMLAGLLILWLFMKFQRLFLAWSHRQLFVLPDTFT